MISRRNFLKESLAVVSYGLAVPSIFSRAVVAAAEENYDVSVSGKTLVVVQLAGGYDGLNVVVPYGDPQYRDLRPTLGVAESDLLTLDGDVALPASMSAFKGLYDAGKVAVVQGVGYPNPNYSHFKAMDIWQTADLDGQAQDGWLGRYFDGLVDGGGHPLAGMAVGRSLPTAFNSTSSSIPAVQSVDTFSLQPAQGDPRADQRQASLLKLYDVYQPAASPFAALLDTTLGSAMQASTELSSVDAAYKPAVDYPQSSLASGLQLLAEMINSGEDQSPVRVGHVMLGGFDTHAQQDQRLDPLLTDVSEALLAFVQDVEAHGRGDDVLTMVWTEFGRRPEQNAQDGTDHGSAVPMFLVGDAVKGGLYGDMPSLTDLDDGNLRFTTDFRSMYATVLEQWLQAPSKDILGGSFDQLDFLNV